MLALSVVWQQGAPIKLLESHSGCSRCIYVRYQEHHRLAPPPLPTLQPSCITGAGSGRLAFQACQLLDSNCTIEPVVEAQGWPVQVESGRQHADLCASAGR